MVGRFLGFDWLMVGRFLGFGWLMVGRFLGFDWLMDGRFLGRLALREKDDEFEYYNITRACLLE